MIHFEWDDSKDRENQHKHGVSFETAQHAFADAKRVIAEDLEHSQKEKRFIASAASARESSPFDSRTERIEFASSERATGEKGRLFMKKKIKYTDEPLGDLSVVRDFLPPPEELAFKEESVKVTMTLSKSSVAFFKKAAQKYHTPYQKMIRKLIDAYATRHPLP